MADNAGNAQYIKKPTRLQCTDKGMANELNLLSPGNHYHLPLEGSSPGVGNKAAASGVYQGVFCSCLSQAIVNIFINQDIEDAHYINSEVYAGEETDERNDVDLDAISDVDPPLPAEDPDPKQEIQRRRGVLRRLDEENRQAAKRIIMRLHRNLGHPSNKELIRLLKSKNASDTLLQAAQEHECGLCDLHKRPTGVPVSSMPKDTAFNDRVQADTLWIKVPGVRNKQPVLMMSDAMTRLLAARHLKAETTEEYIKQLEMAWIGFFGPMKTLQVDEHRAWSSDAMREWETEHGIQLVISPGQAHTRLAILERRHQVTRKAISLFLESNPTVAADRDALVIALNYIVPQLNRIPNVHGFSRSSGSWATRHMCPAFCQKNHRCAIQHTWTHLKGSWKNFDCNNKPAKRYQRPTWITDYAEHFFGSTWASHYSYNLETSATTGVTRPLAVLQS
jgi:hypothetical protein